MSDPETIFAVSDDHSDRYRKITPREGKVALALLELGVRCLPKDAPLAHYADANA